MSSLLPPNATAFERCFDQAFARVADVPILTRSLNNAQTAPRVVLPWLAWERSVDYWNKDWSEQQKRNTIAAAYDVHCHKGTIGALETAMNAIGISCRVEEWFKTSPQGVPYTFNIYIEINKIGATQSQLVDELASAIRINKNLRSHLLGQSVVVRSDVTACAAAVLCLGCEIDFTGVAGSLALNGSWSLDGSQQLNGVKR
ncbi:phage tail protein I [Acinetobacter sp. ANC 3791]|uniref:phage tail protein I n=1 Tax=Acinetobacter sp. ANC 3791 TaxID=2529836 RepID=UPI00103C53CD|nr:phage tail protein I [Acinetobacter sp. ANC 3791]TCB86303.1 phage tail protein I [Acinetobacter sp. ANC 3791]